MKQLLLFFALIAITNVFFGCKKEDPISDGDTDKNKTESQPLTKSNGWVLIGSSENITGTELESAKLKYVKQFSTGYDIVYSVKRIVMSGDPWTSYRTQFGLAKNQLIHQNTIHAEMYESISLNENDLFINYQSRIYMHTADRSDKILEEIPNNEKNGSLSKENPYIFDGRIAKILYVNAPKYIYNDNDGEILNGIVMEDTTLLFVGQTKQFQNNNFYVSRSTKNTKRTVHGGTEQFWFDTDHFTTIPIKEMSGGDNLTKVQFVKGIRMGNQYRVLVSFTNNVCKIYNIDINDYSISEQNVYPLTGNDMDNLKITNSGLIIDGLNSAFLHFDLERFQAHLKIVNQATISDILMPEFATDDSNLIYNFTANNDHIYMIVLYKGKIFFFEKKFN